MLEQTRGEEKLVYKSTNINCAAASCKHKFRVIDPLNVMLKTLFTMLEECSTALSFFCPNFLFHKVVELDNNSSSPSLSTVMYRIKP